MKTVSRRRLLVRRVCAVLLALVAIGFIVVGYAARSTPVTPVTERPRVTATATPTPQASVSPSTGNTPSSSPHATATPTKKVSTCARDIDSFKPSRMVIESLDIDAPVLAMASPGNGEAPVPPFNGPKDPRWAAAWWKDGAAPGSGKGNVRFDVHTYTDHEAIGNLLGGDPKMKDAGDGIAKGAVVKLLDKKGRVGACYKVTDIVTKSLGQLAKSHYVQKISRSTGPSRLVIEFCWDDERDGSWGEWRLRRYIIAAEIP